MSYKYIFGPVHSRRLGISLGLDVIPAKTCPLDCVYCESGVTTNLLCERKEFYPVYDIIEELKTYLLPLPKLDFITFSGAGEPTLYLKIGEIISFLKSNYPQYKICLITNGILFSDKFLQKEVLSADIIIPSVDAADLETFEKINRPSLSLDFISALNGLLEFSREFKGEIWAEVFIIEGINDNDVSLQNIKTYLEKLNPFKIQINSLDRPSAESWVKKASIDTLLKVRALLGDKAEIVSRRESRAQIEIQSADIEQQLLKTLRIRPLTFNDIVLLTNLSSEKVESWLSILEQEKKIKTELNGPILFYRVCDK